MAIEFYKKLNEEEQLIEDIRTVAQQLELVKTRFEFESDEDLVEACIYEIQALTARYRYLIRTAKEQKMKSTDIGALYVRSA